MHVRIKSQAAFLCCPFGFALPGIPRDITLRPFWQTSGSAVAQAVSALQLRDLKQSNSCNLICKPKWWLSCGLTAAHSSEWPHARCSSEESR